MRAKPKKKATTPEEVAAFLVRDYGHKGAKDLAASTLKCVTPRRADFWRQVVVAVAQHPETP